jgi:hypothetical protein
MIGGGVLQFMTCSGAVELGWWVEVELCLVRVPWEDLDGMVKIICR